MYIHTRHVVVVLALAAAAPIAASSQHPPMPAGMSHEEHLAQLEREAEMKQRGAAAMGFDQDKAEHHFRLTTDGGAIEVGVRDPSDTATRTAVQAHLRTIADAFAAGDFGAPFATHGEMPPGVLTLQRLKAAVSYTFEETPNGGRVRINTIDQTALSAAHDFLRYQIREHHTGDPLVVR